MPLTPEDKAREHAERLRQAILKKALSGKIIFLMIREENEQRHFTHTRSSR